MLGSFRDGFLNFYDTTLPFRRSDFPLMHADVLLAIFGFALAAGILIAARRPIGAAVVLVVGVGWPTTLVPGSRPLLVGALALVGVLAVLFLLRSGTHPARGLAQGFAVALVLVVVAAVASTSGSVAKGAFLTWQGWDPYDQPDDPVGVRYVWNSHYLGIHFPKKKTTVLKIKTEGQKRNLYWRATTLDDYTGTGWQESLDLTTESDSNQIDSDSLALLPGGRPQPGQLGQAGRDRGGAQGQPPDRLGAADALGPALGRDLPGPGRRHRRPLPLPAARPDLHGLELRAAAHAQGARPEPGRTTRSRSSATSRSSRRPQCRSSARRTATSS